MEQVKVLGTWTSPFSARVLIGLEEKGVKYEYQEEVLSNKSDFLLQMNPVYKKIPILIHNGQPICESLVILQYIDETWDSKQITPSKPYDRALARFWADFIDKKFFSQSRSLSLRLTGDDIEQDKHDTLENLKILEGALRNMSGGGSLPFFGGEDFGFLDIAIIPFASWFQTFEYFGNFKIPLETEYPLLNAWVKRCMERESIKKVLPSPDRILQAGILQAKNYLAQK
ncbi:hypothetical protein SUGI_0721580 [Cryptomeria japonica]|uniref:probable glutathione S-transferase parC n=1 Tax=Cryptomeria japonica TaxID=3369 RepID=UPI002414C464|nr:probable glutathione S-transferase parC [Cryptomeria japonica]GLJ35970.1 hypothetical protein SUGI_0721580 [Cryptomeria japonica]